MLLSQGGRCVCVSLCVYRYIQYMHALSVSVKAGQVLK